MADPWPQPTLAPRDPNSILVLQTGEIEILGRMPWSSNGTYLTSVAGTEAMVDHVLPAIYKPASGEKPLWDFPAGLWRREVAAYETARWLGWWIVPPTVEVDGPLGIGSLQYFIPARFDEHYFTFGTDPKLRNQLERICLFDLITNNTDRKGGHILIDQEDHCWGIDHGLSFHEEFKLRTVLWDFAGDELSPEDVEAIEHLTAASIPEGLTELLTPAEIQALMQRASWVLENPVFPSDPTGRRYPWPMV